MISFLSLFKDFPSTKDMIRSDLLPFFARRQRYPPFGHSDKMTEAAITDSSTHDPRRVKTSKRTCNLTGIHPRHLLLHS
jgi:hypothetical protein